jgi:eukaryotic-like serine/threonine-protein kinase
VTPEQWTRVRELFEAALDRPGTEVAAWLEAETKNDRAVRDEVLSLLDHNSRAGAFLDQPIAERVPSLLAGDADHGALEPGTMVGDYTIVRELGRGGMGRVYLASDGRLGRQVALKALAPDFTRDPSHRMRLRREAQAAAQLTHPGICTVYALEEVDDALYIATEFVDGRTLREEIVDGRRPSPDKAMRTAHEVASALASAHARGITHRDLKPENVMRTADGRLKVLDFGLARMDSAAAMAPRPIPVTSPGMIIGTPAYMAPEQLNAQPVDARTDVFAFGILMYEFISGLHPFAAASELASVARVLESQARPLSERCPEVPRGLADIVDRCLRKAPADRPASAAEIVGALEASRSRRDGTRSMTWWRTHQLATIALYVVATTVAWQVKESFPGSMTLWLFVGLGIGAATGGIVRGHLVFTEQMNRPRLTAEWHRTERVSRIVDLLMAACLFVDALIVAPTRPLWAVLTMPLALGIALARLLMEPATSAAAFDRT